MNRRDFLKVSGVGATVGLSGCIGPLDGILNRQDISYPEYYGVVPTESISDSGGVFATYVDIQSLENQYDDPLQDPVSDESFGLVSGDALLSVEPTVESAFDDDVVGSAIKSITGVNESEVGVEVSEFVLLNGVILIHGEFSESDLTEDLGWLETEDGVYEDSVLLSDDWLIAPFDGAWDRFTGFVDEPSAIVNDNESLLSFEGSGRGDITVIGINPSFDIDLPVEYNSLIESAVAEDGITTDSRILTSTDISDSLSDVRSNITGDVSYDSESMILSVTADW